jgi:hypothetical protein
MNRYLHQIRTSSRFSRRHSNPYREPVIEDSIPPEGLIKKDLLINSQVQSSEGLEFCVICQDEIYLDIVRKLSCKHTYHVKCIETWFVDNSICPTCKRQF